MNFTNLREENKPIVALGGFKDLQLSFELGLLYA